MTTRPHRAPRGEESIALGLSAARLASAARRVEAGGSLHPADRTSLKAVHKTLRSVADAVSHGTPGSQRSGTPQRLNAVELALDALNSPVGDANSVSEARASILQIADAVKRLNTSEDKEAARVTATFFTALARVAAREVGSPGDRVLER